MDAIVTKLNEIKEQQAEFLAQFKDEQAKRVEKLITDNEELRTRLVAMEELAAKRKEYFSLPGVDEGKETFSLLKSVRGIVTKNWDNAGFEKEIFDNMSKKTAMGTTYDNLGGYIVPTEYVPEMVELLTANTIVSKLGVTMLTGLSSGSLKMPKQTAGATAYWVAENAAITESNLTWGQIEMQPRKVAALVKLSNELIVRSNPSAEAVIRRDIVGAIARAIDLAALRGSGVSNEPRGIANTPGINTVAIGTSGGTLTFDHLLDMQYALQEDNAFQGNLGYAFHPAVRRMLLKSKIAQFSGDSGGEYVIQPMVSDAQLKSWMGFDYQMSTQLPITLSKGSSAANLTEVYFANWQEMLVGQWAGMTIMASQETSDAFEKMQTWIRVAQEVDIQVRHAESFCLCNDAASS